MTRTSVITLALAVVISAALSSSPSVAQTTWTAADLAERTLQRRAVEAAICGMPLVNFDAMRQAYCRDAGAQYNDVMYWSKPEVRARLERPEQHWRFSAADIVKGAYWDQYVAAYEDVLNATSTPWPPRRPTGSRFQG
jgi:Polyphosphate kinase 2 (PPK2)